MAETYEIKTYEIKIYEVELNINDASGWMEAELKPTVAKFGLELRCIENWGGNGTILANIHQPDKNGTISPDNPEIKKIIPSSYEGFCVSMYFSKAVPTVEKTRERIWKGY